MRTAEAKNLKIFLTSENSISKSESLKCAFPDYLLNKICTSLKSDLIGDQFSSIEQAVLWDWRELGLSFGFALNSCVIFKFPSNKMRRVILSPWACIRNKSDKAISITPLAWPSAHGHFLFLGRRLSILVLS